MPKPVKKATPKKRAAPKLPSSDPVLRARQMFVEHMTKAETPETHAPSFQDQLSAHMAKLGAKGGKISGARRMTNLSAKKRREIARKAAAARWKGHGGG